MLRATAAALGAGEPSEPLDYLRHLILPVLALAIPWVGYLARLVRACMLDVINSDYVRAALAFGLPRQLVQYKFALRNAIIPTVAVLGVGLGNLLGGAVLIETIFSWPGVGALVYTAISARDLRVVQGATLVIALTFVLLNVLVDLLQMLVDPRQRAAA